MELTVSNRLIQLQSILIVLYAISLPLSLTASEAILIAGLLLRGILWFLSSKSQDKDKALAPLVYPLIAFASATTLSGLTLIGFVDASKSLSSLWTIIFVYLWAFPIFATNRTLMFQAIQALLVTSSIAGLFGAVEQLANFHPFGYQYLQGTGFLGGPMAYAGQMQLFSLLSLGIMTKGSYKHFKGLLANVWVFRAIVLANFLGVIFASERSAWLGIMAGVLAIAAVLSWKVLLKSSLAILIVAIVAWFTIPVVQTRLSPLLNWKQDVSSRVRFEVWGESIKCWHTAPIFGIGTCRFPHLDIKEAIVPGRSKDLNHAHSNYIHILTTTGIFGLIFYIWLWLSTLKLSFIQMKRDDQAESGLALGIFGGIISLIIAGIFEYNFGTAQVRLAQWFLLAMLLPKVQPKESQFKRRKKFQALNLILSLSILSFLSPVHAASSVNLNDGSKFLSDMSKTCSEFSDYTFESELNMAKKGNDDNTKGVFYFKKPNLIRVEDKSDGTHGGSVVVRRADGKIRAAGGSYLRFLKMNLTPDSRLILLPNGFSLVKSDLDSLLSNVRYAVANGSKTKVTSSPVIADKLNKNVYIFEVYASTSTGDQLTDRIFINPDNNVPFEWDIFKGGSLYSIATFKNFHANVGLSDDLFKM